MTPHEELATVAGDLGEDEVRVLVYLGRRLRAGADVYGALDLATDVRDFDREAAAEYADAAIYGAMRECRRGLKGAI
ncbi:MAG: hypothetical protein ACHREM_26200 [Polyangiales bacterium]